MIMMKKDLFNEMHFGTDTDELDGVKELNLKNNQS